MKYIRFLFAVSLLLYGLYFLGKRQTIAGNTVPPLAMFLDPFHGFLQNAEKKEYPFETLIERSTLKNKVSVFYDSLNIPHLFAENDDDLYFVQGYVIAQHRLWQMEFQTLAAAGRVSEIIGNKGLSFDRTQRRIGMVKGAKATFEEFNKNPVILNSIEKYADGVNAYINSLDYKNLPIEYKLLDYTPEKWSAFNTALLVEYMVNSLIGWDDDIENTNALKLFGRDTFDLLFPDYPEGTDPVINNTDFGEFEALTTVKPDPVYSDVSVTSSLSESNPDNGSNNWAVSGTKTASGKPILANDPHLGLNLPSLWIINHLKAPGIDVMGYSFTGGPGIVIGFNDSISWGFTNSPRDQRDWYSIKFRDESKSQYFYDSTWKETQMVIEEIKQRGEASFFDTVYYTHHGPIVYDERFPGRKDKNSLSLKWSGHQPSRIINSLYYLNRAQNYDEFASALQYWDAPSQNIVFASVNGDIALRVEGTFPLKWEEQGKFILDGSEPRHEWSGFIPHDHNAYMHNPEREFVSSANQHAVSPAYPYYVYQGSNEAYRNRRINRLLSNMKNIKPEDLMTMQQDAYSIKAEEILPLFLDSLKQQNLSKNSKSLLEVLKKWDYQYQPELTAPFLFEVWWKEFNNLLWDEMHSEQYSLKIPSSFTTIQFIKNNPRNNFIDHKSTPEKESLSDLINNSFQKAVDFLEKWREENDSDAIWSNYNKVSLIHLTRVLTSFGTGTLEVPGSGDVINASKGSHGPSLRLVVEMTDPPSAWGVYAGGQSGNPGSPRYLDYLKKWQKGEYLRLVRHTSEAFNDPEIKVFEQQFSPNAELSGN